MLIGYVFVSTGMVLAHLYGVVVVACHCLALLCLVLRRQLATPAFLRAWFTLALTTMSTCVCYAPVLPLLLQELRRETAGAKGSDFPLLVLARYGWTATALLGAVLLGLALYGLWQRRYEQGPCLLCLIVIAAPTAMACLLRMRATSFPRFALFALPFFLAAAVVGFGSLWERWPSKIGRGLLLGCCCLLFSYWLSESWQALDSSGVAEALAAVPKGATVIATGGDAYLFRFYGGEQVLLPRPSLPLPVPDSKETCYVLFHDVSWASARHRRWFERWGQGPQGKRFFDVVLYPVEGRAMLASERSQP